MEYTRVVWEGKRKRSEENYRWTYQAQDAYVKVGPDVAPETDDAAPAEGGSDGVPEEEQFSDPAPEPVAEPQPEPVPAAPDGGAAPPALP